MNKEICLKISFKFWGSVVPNVYEVDAEGKGISTPRKEVSKIRHDGSRYFQVAIKRPGRYLFSGFCLSKEDQLFHLLNGKKDGFFILSQDGNVFLE